MEQNVAEKNILQRNLIKFIIGDVFNLITEDDVLRINVNEKGEKVWFYKGVVLSKEQIKKLRIQAESFLKSDLWKILKDELMYNAQANTLNKGVVEADLLSGKMLMYLIEVIENRLYKMLK